MKNLKKKFSANCAAINPYFCLVLMFCCFLMKIFINFYITCFVRSYSSRLLDFLLISELMFSYGFTAFFKKTWSFLVLQLVFMVLRCLVYNFLLCFFFFAIIGLFFIFIFMRHISVCIFAAIKQMSNSCFLGCEISFVQNPSCSLAFCVKICFSFFFILLCLAIFIFS